MTDEDKKFEWHRIADIDELPEGRNVVSSSLTD